MNSSNPVPIPRVIITNDPSIASFTQKGVGTTRSVTFTSVSAYYEFLKSQNRIEKPYFFTMLSKNLIGFNFSFEETGDVGLNVEFIESDDYFEKLYFETFLDRIGKLKTAKTPEERSKILTPTQYYIAFGLGDDLTYWSDFHTVSLVGAQTLQKFDDPKTIQLEFAPTQSLQNFDWNKFQFMFKNPLSQQTTIEATEIMLPFFERKNIEEVEFIREKGTLWGTYELVLSKFLKAAFNTDNVLIVLPKNMTIVIQPYVTRLLNKHFPRDTEFEYFTQTFDRVLQTFRNPGSLGEVGEKPDLINFLNDFYAPIGGSIAFQSTERGKKAIPMRPEVLAETDDAIEVLLSVRIFKDVKDKKKEIFDLIQQIKKELERLMSDSNSEIILYQETNTELLINLDKDLPNVSIDPLRPLIIFGERKLIYNQIYGDKYKTNYELPYQNNRENVVKFISNILSKNLNLYKSQDIQLTELQQFIAADRREEISEFTRYKNFPVFRFNVDNPNVISIEVNDNKFYFAFLNQAVRFLFEYYDRHSWLTDNAEKIRDAKRGLSAEKTLNDFKKYLSTNEYLTIINNKNQALTDVPTLKKTIDFINTLTPEQLGEFLPFRTPENEEARLQELSQYFSLEEVPLLNKGDTLRTIFDVEQFSLTLQQRSIIGVSPDTGLAQRYNEMFQEWGKLLQEEYNSKSLVSFVEEVYQKNPYLFMYDMLEFFDSASFTVEIETLPFFPISSLFYLGKPCILLANRPDLIGSPKTKNPLDLIISGAYAITGMEHRISSTGAISKFTLRKYPMVVK